MSRNDLAHLKRPSKNGGPRSQIDQFAHNLLAQATQAIEEVEADLADMMPPEEYAAFMEQARQSDVPTRLKAAGGVLQKIALQLWPDLNEQN